MAKAVGILEVFGLVAGFVAADAGCKAADVAIENFDKNKPGNADALPVPLIVSIKFRGDVAAERVSGVVSRHIIPNPEGDTEKMLKINALDKN